jgi:hypothetical protein
MLLIRNTGNSFADVSADSGAVFAQPWLGRGLAIGDIDNDGRVDVVATNDGPAHILHFAQRNAHAKSLAHTQIRRPQKQSRWHWRRDQADHLTGGAHAPVRDALHRPITLSGLPGATMIAMVSTRSLGN